MYCFRDIAIYLSKIADFDPPYLHLAPTQGVIPVEFRGDLWHQKTRVAGLPCCLCDPMFSRFSRKPTCDRRTDGRTQSHSIHRACIASRGKKYNYCHNCKEPIFNKRVYLIQLITIVIFKGVMLLTHDTF